MTERKPQIAFAPVDPDEHIHVRYMSDDYLTAQEKFLDDYDSRPCTKEEARHWPIRKVRIEIDE